MLATRTPREQIKALAKLKNGACARAAVEAYRIASQVVVAKPGEPAKLEAPPHHVAQLKELRKMLKSKEGPILADEYLKVNPIKRDSEANKAALYALLAMKASEPGPAGSYAKCAMQAAIRHVRNRDQNEYAESAVLGMVLGAAHNA